jgi:ABC-type Na+ efflux pump permease subunit
MKIFKNKKVIISIIIVLVVLIGGFIYILLNTKEVDKTVCTLNKKYDDYEINSKAEIYFDEKTGVVNKVIESETVISNNKEILESFENLGKNLNKELNKLEYYNFTSKIVETKLEGNLTIDYEKINLKKMLEVDSTITENVVNNKINYKLLLENNYLIYGAVCK